MCHRMELPICNVVSSHAANALPERNTADTADSSIVRDFRYSATTAVFCSFLVVAAMASQVCANLSMSSQRIDERPSRAMAFAACGNLVVGAFWRLGHLITVRSLRNLVRFLVAVQLLPALESGEETLVGGQAVLEGVMMRSPHAWAIACRKPSGEVVTMSEPLERPSERHKWMAWPIVRGVMTLGYAMTLGYRALRFSANVAIEDMMQEDVQKSRMEATAPVVAQLQSRVKDSRTQSRE